MRRFACVLLALGGTLALVSADDTSNTKTTPVSSSFTSEDGVDLKLDAKTTIKASLPYARLDNTIFPLPVWVVVGEPTLLTEDAPRVWKDGQALPPQKGKSTLRVRLFLKNLMAEREVRWLVQEALRDDLSRKAGTKKETFQIAPPVVKKDEVRVALCADGAGIGLPREMELSLPVTMPVRIVESAGPMTFEILPGAVEALEKARGEPLKRGDVYLRIDGMVRVKFEEEQFKANYRVVTQRLDELRSALRTIGAPDASPSDTLLHVPLDAGRGSQATQLDSFLIRQVSASISVAKGAKVDLGLVQTLGATVLEQMMQNVRLTELKDEQRVTVLFGDRATLTGSMGEINKLSPQSEDERATTLKTCVEEARKRQADRTYKGKLNLAYTNLAIVPGLAVGNKIEGGIAGESRTREGEEQQTKRATDALQRGLNRLREEWKGKLPTLRSIRLDTKSTADILREENFEISKSVSTAGWSSQRWPTVSLAQVTTPVIDVRLVSQQNAEAIKRYERFQKLLDSPSRLDGFEKAYERVKELEGRLKEYQQKVDLLAQEKKVLVADLKRMAIRQLELEEMLEDHPVREQQRLRTWVHPIHAIAVDQKGQHALVAAGTEVGVWDAKKRIELRTFDEHGSVVDCVAISPDGKFAASGSRGQVIFVWEIGSLKVKHKFEDHTKAVCALAFTPDGKMLLSASDDETVRVWSLESGQQSLEFKEHEDKVKCVAVTPDGKFAISGGRDKVIRMWDIKTGKVKRTFTSQKKTVSSLAISSDGRWLVSGSYDGYASLWDLKKAGEKQEKEDDWYQHTDPVNAVSFTHDGKGIITCADNGSLRLWDRVTGRQLRCFTGHNGDVLTAALTADSRYLVSGGADGTVRLWRMPKLRGEK